MRRLGFALLFLYLTAAILPVAVNFIADRLPAPHVPDVDVTRSTQGQETAGFFSLESVGGDSPDEVRVAITALVREPAAACSMVIVYDPTSVEVSEAMSGRPVAPADWIAPTMVRQDEIVVPGQINYFIEGMDGPLLSADEKRTLGTITFHIRTSEVPTVAIKSLYVRDPVFGTMLVDVLVTPQQPLLLIASPPDESARTPAPSPSPTPVAVLPSPTPLPAPTATPVPADEPPSPMPTPAPLPPTQAPASLTTGSDCERPPMAYRDGIYIRLLQGQTLYGVARAFNITVEALMLANGITDVSTIPAETILFVPVPPPAGMGYTAYYVAPYDTLRSIADDFNLPIEALTCRNGDVLADGLQAGEWLRLRP